MNNKDYYTRFQEYISINYVTIFELDEIVQKLKELYVEVTGKEFYSFGYPVGYMYLENYTYYFEHLKAALNAILTLQGLPE